MVPGRAAREGNLQSPSIYSLGTDRLVAGESDSPTVVEERITPNPTP
jgi:hypothetical protein